MDLLLGDELLTKNTIIFNYTYLESYEISYQTISKIKKLKKFQLLRVNHLKKLIQMLKMSKTENPVN